MTGLFSFQYGSTLFSNGSWISVWNIQFRDDEHTGTKRHTTGISYQGCMTTFPSIFYFYAILIAFIFLELLLVVYVFFFSIRGCPLFWRGKWAIWLITWMQRFNNISSYYRFTCLSTFFISLVLVIDIITIIVISKKAQLCMI